MSTDNNEVTPELIAEQLAAKGVIDDAVSEKVHASGEEETKESEEKNTAAPEEKVIDAEAEATAKGWKADGPKSAEEFLRAEPLYDELKQRGKEIKDLKMTLDELKSFMSEQKEMGYKQALNDLDLAKTQAIEAGDVDAVKNLDEQIKEHETTAQQASPPEVDQFLKKNDAWLSDPSAEAQDMRDFAHKRDQELTAFNMPPEAHLEQIETDLKLRFPHRFGEVEEVPQSRVSSVESDSAPAGSRGDKTIKFADLSPEQKDCARQFEKRGVMKVDEYIEHLKELGEL